MENVFKLPTNPIVNIKDEFEVFQSEICLSYEQPLPASDADIKKLMCIDDADEFARLQQSVDLDEHLSQPSDARILPFKPSSKPGRPILEIPKQILQLNAFRELQTFKKKYYGSPFGSHLYTNRYPEMPAQVDSPTLEPFRDFLISIRIYRPLVYATIGVTAKPRFSEEFIVRGQQHLSELRDKISCDCKRPLYDVSDGLRKETSRPECSGDPGFFFITDTFYNDTRNPSYCDYSEVIIKWAESRKRGTFTKPFRTARMEDTKFIDLKVRLGFPQVYQHFGNCEHLFTFSWIKVVDRNDCLSREEYPLLKSLDLPRQQLCGFCGERSYSYIVRKSNRHVHDPALMCRVCFNSYHYVDGVKIGDFAAYYIDGESEDETMELDTGETGGDD